jgi:hypothetical protein
MANRNINTSGIPQLTPAQLRKIIALENAYTAEVKANPMVWLPNKDIVTLDQSVAPDFGFSGFVRHSDLGDIDFSQLSVDELESFTKRSRRSAKGGKGKGKGGSGGGGQQGAPSAAVAEQVVGSYFKGMQPAANTGNLLLGEQNALFGSKQKAITYRDAWRHIVEPHHIMFWSEVSAEFLQEIGQAYGHGYWCSKANTRDQAVGITAHPRLKKIAGPFSYDRVASVQGIPDLRPAFVVIFEDLWSGVIIKAVVNHLKSMRGGPKLTSPVRYQQCVEIVKAHGVSTSGVKPALKNQQTRNIWRNKVFGRGFTDHGTTTVTMPLCILPDAERKLDLQERIKRGITVMAGDWNCLLGQVTDVDPLIQAGYLLIDPTGNVPTHSMGSRLDGFFAEKGNFEACDADVADGPDEVDGDQ